MNQPNPAPAVRYLEVDAEQAGQRLDNFLLTALKGVPRSLIYRVVRTGQVRVNHGRAQAGLRINAGDRIRIPPLRLTIEKPQITPLTADLNKLATAIIYEDNKLLIINKPTGIAVHGGSGINYGVIEALRILRHQNLELVHRLDRDTSGCLMLAKRRSELHWLHQALQNNQLEKRYLALLVGCMTHSKIEVDMPLRKNTVQSGERIVRIDVTGKPARTEFKRLRQFATTTLVEIRPHTGRTHQIRVHAAHLGMPVAGDEKYGNKEFNTKLRKIGLKRLFLHAKTLIIPRSDTSKNLEITAPLDAELAMLLNKLYLL